MPSEPNGGEILQVEIEKFVSYFTPITNKFSDSSDILERWCDFIGQVNNMLCYLCKLTACVKNSYFNLTTQVYMDASCGYSPLTKLRTCAFHGETVCVEFGTCLIRLILTYIIY